MSTMRSWDDEVERLIVHGRDGEAASLAVRHLQPVHEGAPMGPLEQLDNLAPVLGTVINGIRDDQFDNATPCTEFTVEGVLQHMLVGATMFTAAFKGEAPQPAPTGDLRAATGEALGNLVAAMHSPGALERTVDAPFGAAPGETFARFVVLDGLVHGWDIATATGQEYDPPASVVAEVQEFARSAITPMRGDVFAAETTAPEGATPIERLAAFTGRKV